MFLQGIAATYPEWGSTAVGLVDRYLQLRAPTTTTTTSSLVPDIDDPNLARSLRQIPKIICSYFLKFISFT